MPFHQTSPEDDGPTNGVHFPYRGTKCGTKWHAFTAGPCVWLKCHPYKKTKPCCEKITGGELVCPFCGSMPPAKTLGWLPVWCEVDYRPACVILYEHQRALVDQLEHNERVLIGREEKQEDGTWIARPLGKGPKFQTTLLYKIAKHDVSHSLLRMWKIPALTAWFECSEKEARDNAVSLPTGTAVKDSGEPFDPMHQAAAKRYGADVVEVPASEPDADADRAYLAELQRGTLKASNNGHHKRAKKG